MDINAIQNGDFSSLEGTWENGRGDTIVFSKDRVTQFGKIWRSKRWYFEGV